MVRESQSLPYFYFSLTSRESGSSVGPRFPRSRSSGVREVGLNRAKTAVRAALQNTAREPREALLRRVRMNGGQCERVPRVWGFHGDF